jgi:hypothetical protein
LGDRKLLEHRPFIINLIVVESPECSAANEDLERIAGLPMPKNYWLSFSKKQQICHCEERSNRTSKEQLASFAIASYLTHDRLFNRVVISNEPARV